MNAIIIDDEILNIKNLEILLKENIPSVKIMGGFLRTDEAKEFTNSKPVDLVFLDINMPEKDGFDFLQMFPNRDFQVIFVTAYEEHALKALKAGATDYILKPILLDELKAAVEKAKANYENSHKFSTDGKITLTYSGGRAIVEPNEIIYIQGIDNISKIILTENRNVIVAKTLKYFEQQLDDRFFRVHKSFLVNLEHAFRIISQTEHFLEMKENLKIPVSRRNLKTLSEKLTS